MQKGAGEKQKSGKQKAEGERRLLTTDHKGKAETLTR